MCNKPEEYYYENNQIICQFVIPGRPATKKTHNTLVKTRQGRNVILPSPQFKKFEQQCKKYVLDAWKNKGKSPINYGVSISVKIYLNNKQVGDHCGYLQALGDIFQKYELVENDKFIFWDNMGEHWFAGIDKENPRTEITVKRFKHLLEK